MSPLEAYNPVVQCETRRKGAGERLRRGQVGQEPRKKLRRSSGRVRGQEHM